MYFLEKYYFSEKLCKQMLSADCCVNKSADANEQPPLLQRLQPVI